MTSKPISIILDTDIGDDIDDALALAVALNSPELEIVGVTTVFRDAPRRAIMVREVLQLLGRADIPVFAGCSQPFFPDWENLHEGQNLGRQFEALDPNLTWDETRHAVDFLIQSVRNFDIEYSMSGETRAGEPRTREKLTLVPIGALTNIALAFQIAPDIVDKCRVVLMGGKWRGDFSEWNILCDPEAAAMVFNSGADIAMVGLDVTEQCVLTGEETRQFAASPYEHARFSGKLIELWGHKVVLHDPLTVLSLFSDVVQFAPMRLEVGLHGAANRGRTTVVEGAPNCRVAAAVDAGRAKKLFLERALKEVQTAKPRIRWGILGAGHIAREFADGVQESQTGVLAAVGSRTQQNADAFASEYSNIDNSNSEHSNSDNSNIEYSIRAHGSYQALLDDAEVDAVYIATPHPMHAEWTIKAAEAGKHILVEKPIGLNAPEATAMLDAAAENDVFLMEAFMYRCHPQTRKLVELIRDGTIGEVRLIRASFCYDGGLDLSRRAFANALGGGGILDVGCYPVSAARLIAGAAQGKAFAEPIDVKGQAHLGETGVDEWATALLKFPGDILAQVSTGVALDAENGIHVYGTKGSISIAEPWIPSRWSREPLEIAVRIRGEETRTVVVEADKDLYSYEADMVGEHIAQRQAPAMSWDDTLGNIRVLDRWRDQIGLTYESEKPENATRTVTGRPLQVKPNTKMKYGRIDGLDKPLSHLIIGADTTHTMPDTAILFDAFFDLGGNTFDTSHTYGHEGSCERNLGAWVRNRGVREQVVVLEKGGNYPNDNGAGMLREMQASLDNTGLEYFDIYMLHRDNQNVPIDEWMDALIEGHRKGVMKAYGVSNFTLPRLQAAVEYLAKKGAPKLCALSNNFSLARMLTPVWDGCESSSDSEYREWLEQTQMPLFPWSSQARGFFTERASRENTSSEEFNRCWYSEENFERKERAEILAKEKGVLPINIALAYVLCQPFPVFSLIGAKRRSEIISTMGALDIELTPQERAWLDLRTETPRD